jgi:hypothetical protein
MADYQRFTAKNLPAEYRDLTRWPQIDTTIEEVREAVTARQRAIAAYVQKASSLTAASAACDLSKAELLRLFRRCLELHPDGRIYGWRALQPYIHVHRYKRTAPIPNKGRGLAGAFSLFLAEHPNIKEELDVLFRSHDSPILQSTNTSDAVAHELESHRASTRSPLMTKVALRCADTRCACYGKTSEWQREGWAGKMQRCVHERAQGTFAIS